MFSQKNNQCRRCQLLEEQDRQDTDELIDEQLSLEVNNLVPVETRNQRLAVCKDCPFYQNGLCLKCGCYCRFRASLKNKICPDHRWSN